jgi:hypothetical protein
MHAWCPANCVLERKQVTQVEVIKDIVRLNNVRNSFDVIDPETGGQGDRGKSSSSSVALLTSIADHPFPLSPYPIPSSSPIQQLISIFITPLYTTTTILHTLHWYSAVVIDPVLCLRHWTLLSEHLYLQVIIIKSININDHIHLSVAYIATTAATRTDKDIAIHWKKLDSNQDKSESPREYSDFRE